MEVNWPVEFRNPVCRRVWVEGYYLCWEADQKEERTLSGRFRRELAELRADLSHVVDLFNRYGPLWRGDRIRVAEALSRIRTFQLLWQLWNGTLSEVEAAFFAPLRRSRKQWDNIAARAGVAGANLILPRGFTKTPLQGMDEAVLKARVYQAAEMRLKGVTPPPIVEGDELLLTVPVAELAKAAIAALQPDAEERLRASAENLLRRRRKSQLWLIVNEKGDAEFVPVEPSTEFWPCFRLPGKPLKDPEAKAAWLSRELVRNGVDLLRSNLKMDVKRCGDGAALTIFPADAFTWCVGSVLLEHEGEQPRCPICGRLAPPGRRYCSKQCAKKAQATAPKQKVLGYLYPQVKRGRLTSEQYGFVKGLLREEPLRTEKDDGAIVRAVVDALACQWPGANFTWIQEGYGARRQV